MKPIDQTVLTVPGGNCFSACVATLLGLELVDVPYFMGDFEEADKGAWFDRFAAWLKPHGLYPLNLRCPPDGAWQPQGAYVLSAGSPRGAFMHSVVAVDGEIFHDPHPSRAGLVRLEEQEATILVPFRPASAKSPTCDLADCEHPPFTPLVTSTCRVLARLEADHARSTSGPDAHDYVKLQDEAERAWHRRAVWCTREHGKDGVAHPGCKLCPVVHQLPYEAVR